MSLRYGDQLKSYQKEYADYQVDHFTELEPDDRKTYHVSDETDLKVR
jgi:hypothetical protein